MERARGSRAPRRGTGDDECDAGAGLAARRAARDGVRHRRPQARAALRAARGARDVAHRRGPGRAHRAVRRYAVGMTTTVDTTIDPLDFLAIDRLLDDEERLIRDTVRAWVNERIVPSVAEW